MPYLSFNPLKPDPATDNGTAAFDHTRNNMKSLRDGVVLGAFEDWNAIMAAPYNQTPQITYSYGAERLRVNLTYNVGDNPSVIHYEYSSNSGSSYDTIGTQTITYDASQNVTAITWS